MKYLIIGGIYRKLWKPLLFKRDPEDVHDMFTRSGALLARFRISRGLVAFICKCTDSSLEQEILGINFKNPVGLSAGFDKDANLCNILPDVGFGYMQIGSVTLHPYEGNPKPRLYRLKKSSALIVYYGLKNIGIEEISKKIQSYGKFRFPISISIAKTNSVESCTSDQGAEDYFGCYKKCLEDGIGDFYTINISCPNTFGGEPFTTPEKLELLLSKLRSLKSNKPMFVKMPINLEWNEFESLLEIIVKYKVDGVIIGNLNKSRDPKYYKEELPEINGGISGKPTWDLSNYLIGETYKGYKDKLIIIGVGGIFTAQDAYHKIKLGSSLVQLITGMIFNGPQTIGEINKGLVQLMKEDGYSNISEAIGAHHR
jgi:dihydroorotate dehydrogenase subfamily 2